MAATAPRLLPQPLEVECHGEPWHFAGTIELVDHDFPNLTAAQLVRALWPLERAGFLAPTTGSRSNSTTGTTLSISCGSSQESESYELSIGPECHLRADGPRGAFYGACTLQQWLGSATTLSRARVVDRPAFPVRGVQLDVSRNKVPKLHTLMELIDRLALLKINQLQLYMEHTFAYSGHETVWKGWSPLDGDDIDQLVAHCEKRFVELVPNQNSFGHMHRWLVHEPYRQLAECPEGIQHPFSHQIEPYSLCPTDPRSLELLEDLYDQLLAHFPSRRFNVGLDETFDLGEGRSAQICSERGRGRVYLDFLTQVAKLAGQRGRQMLFWGDIILQHPELVSELPEGLVALEWGYEANHPFEERCESFARSGIEFWVCPGTSSWNSFAGRPLNAVTNARRAAKVGLDAGASGYLMTDWGDFGHYQPLPVSYLGFAAGAANAWNCEATTTDLDVWESVLDEIVLGTEERGLAKPMIDLGESFKLCGAEPSNGTALFRLLMSWQDTLEHSRYGGLSADGLEGVVEQTTRARQAVEALRIEAVTKVTSDPIEDELVWVAEILSLAARLGIERLTVGEDRDVDSIPLSRRRPLADELDDLLDLREQLWLGRNRTGGWSASRALLEPLVDSLRH